MRMNVANLYDYLTGAGMHQSRTHEAAPRVIT
jgi:hypothetical protein